MYRKLYRIYFSGWGNSPPRRNIQLMYNLFQLFNLIYLHNINYRNIFALSNLKFTAMNKQNIDFLNVGLTVVQPNGVTVLDSVTSVHDYQVHSLDKFCMLPFFQSFNQDSLYRILLAYCNYCMLQIKPIETNFVLDNCICILSISITYKKY